MSKSVSEANYVCTLTEKSLKKAKEELNEDPKNRLGAVETFRQWILQQPHIKCPTDTGFLLPFLRVRYFSQLEARKLLESFLSRRTKLAAWYRNLDTTDSKIQAVYDSGFILLLPEKDDEGRQIFVMRPGYLDITGKAKYKKADVIRAFACVCDYMYFIEENTTVNGTVTLLDFTGYGMKHSSFLTIEERRDFLQTWQSAYPARVKQIHVYNTGAMMEILMSILKLCMAEKIQQRLKIQGQTLEGVFKDIPMKLLPVEYLPDDYKGPNAGTEKQLIDRMKKLLAEPAVRSRIQYMSSEKFGMDEKLKPKETGDVPVGSFRKLNID
jgi:hypothetical protein